MNNYEPKTYEQDLDQLNDEFKEFLKTKGIKAKFKLAFENMKESAKKQHEVSKENFEEVKRQSIENNKEFYEFLKTKGVVAKFKLAFKNMKEGAKNARVNNHHVNISTVNYYTNNQVNVNTLTNDFESYLKSKGLDKKYKIEIVEVDE